MGRFAQWVSLELSSQGATMCVNRKTRFENLAHTQMTSWGRRSDLGRLGRLSGPMAIVVEIHCGRRAQASERSGPNEDNTGVSRTLPASRSSRFGLGDVAFGSKRFPTQDVSCRSGRSRHRSATSLRGGAPLTVWRASCRRRTRALLLGALSGACHGNELP